MLPQQQEDSDTRPEALSLAKCLHVEATTWARDSHELFDYEARHVQQKTYFMRRAARVVRSAAEVEVHLDRLQHSATSSSGRPFDHLLSVKNESPRGSDSPSFVVVPAERSTSPVPATSLVTKKLWLIVKELNGGRHKLVEGDVIKLGRYKLRVKQLGVSADVVPDLKWEDNEPQERPVSKEDASTKQCRICLLDGCTDDDPLVCPCNCRGSIEFVHVECLRRWVRGKLGVPEDAQGPKVATFLRQIFCELCKSPFPSAVTVNGDKVPVVPLPPTDAPFVVLEHIIGAQQTGPNPPSSRGLHILCLNSRKEVKLGRGHESDVRIADVSISRYHATIRFAEGHFLLEDHQSKFGTLVSLRRNIVVDGNHPLSVQVGRTVMKFQIADPPVEFGDLLEMPIAPQPGATADDDGEDGSAAAQQRAGLHDPHGGGGDPVVVSPDGVAVIRHHHQWGAGGASAATEHAQQVTPVPRAGGVAETMVHALHEVSAQLSHALGLGSSRSFDGVPPPAPPPHQQSDTSVTPHHAAAAAAGSTPGMVPTVSLPFTAAAAGTTAQQPQPHQPQQPPPPRFGRGPSV